MKKITAILFAFVMVGLSSCSSSDDDNNSINAGSLIGKWRKIQTGLLVNGEIEWKDSVNFSGCDLDIFEYLENGSHTQTYYRDDYTGGCIEEQSIATWSLKNNELTMNFEDDGLDIMEIEIKENQLILKEDFFEDDSESTLIIEYTLLTRI